MNKPVGINATVSAALGKAVELMLSVVRPESTADFEKTLRDFVGKHKVDKARAHALTKSSELSGDGQFASAGALLELAVTIVQPDEPMLVALADAWLRTPHSWQRAVPVLAELRRRGSRTELLAFEPCLSETTLRFGGQRFLTLQAYLQRHPHCQYPVLLKIFAWSVGANDLRVSASMLEQAIALDPDDAEAHSMLAYVHRQLGEELFAQIEDAILLVIRK